MPHPAGIVRDLEAEQDALDRVVAALDEEGRDTITPVEPWMVRDQIGRLAAAT